MDEDTLPKMFRKKAEDAPEIIVQYAKNSAGKFCARTYRELYDETRWTAAGLLELNVKRGDCVGLLSDNCKEWLAADLGVLALGAADVPRGGDTLVQELTYILNLTECVITFAENKQQALKILSCKDTLSGLKTIITFDAADGETRVSAEEKGVRILSFAELAEMGKTRCAARPGEVDGEIDSGGGGDLATVIFTSGTTGEPKGVMLTHRSFLCQIPPFRNVFDMKPGEIWLSVLPVWHVFERAVEYIILYNHNTLAYSKPIGSVLMADFLYIRPHWIATVPRVWEAIMDGIMRSVKQMGGFQKFFFDFFVSFALMYRYFWELCFGLIPNYHGRVRAFDAAMGFFPWLLLSPVRGLAWLISFRRLKKRLGGRFRAGLTGGGSIQPRVDHFFNAVGLKLQEAYGLTETAPIVSARQHRKSRRGTIGQLLVPGAEFKILDKSGSTLPPGHNGILHIRGEQVMKGYYKKPELSAAVLSADGWLNTGDITMSTFDKELRITGRAKDTIVLRSGENAEPVPIENRLKESPRIFQCMVVGQDQKYLAALIVPVQEEIMAFAEENNIPIVDYELLLQQPEINEILWNDISGLINSREGFKMYERIHKFKLLSKPFEPGTEISAKQEPLRHKINARYAKEIQALFR